MAPAAPGVNVATNSVLSDTIGTRHRLAVAIGDAAGGAAAGRVVRFEPAAPNEGRIYVVHVDSQFARPVVPVVTDSRGRVQVDVQLAVVAGPAGVIVRVPELGFVDTVVYDIRPGMSVRIAIEPRDTAVYADVSYTVRGRVMDRAGNERQETVTYASHTGPVTVNAATGAATVSGIGRGRMLVRSNALVDTAYVSVIPPGQIASEPFFPGNGGPIGLDLLQLDGSGQQRIGPGIENVFIAHGFGWSPDGKHVAVADGHFVSLVTPGVGVTPILELSEEVLTSARFSRDGQWIYFAKQHVTPTRPQGLYRVHPDGTGMEHIGAIGGYQYPAPSHDGQTVAFVDYNCGPAYCIRLLDVATRSNRTWGTGGGSSVVGYVAAWSPTEDLIAYATGQEVRVLRSDGTGGTTLSSEVPNVRWIDWSPDGRWIVVAAAQGVMLFEVATGLRLPIAQLTAFGPTAWRP